MQKDVRLGFDQQDREKGLLVLPILDQETHPGCLGSI